MRIIDFIVAIFCVKLVEDNLPNLHYKKLGKAFDKYIAPFILLAYIGWLTILVKITRDPEQKKTLLTILTLVAVGIALTKVVEEQKKQTTS